MRMRRWTCVPSQRGAPEYRTIMVWAAMAMAARLSFRLLGAAPDRSMVSWRSGLRLHTCLPAPALKAGHSCDLYGTL